MIKNISMIQIKKGEKEFELHVRDASTWGEIFDVGEEIRQIGLKGINEMLAQEAKLKAEAEEVKVETITEGA